MRSIMNRSTDQMDGLHTPEEVANKNRLVVWCSNCNSWFHFERDPSAMLAADGQICDCGSENGLIGNTVVSERTWSPDRKPPTQKKRR